MSLLWQAFDNWFQVLLKDVKSKSLSLSSLSKERGKKIARRVFVDRGLGLGLESRRSVVPPPWIGEKRVFGG